MENDLKQRALSMAQTIWKTLFMSRTAFEVLSWGITQKTATIYEQMLALQLKVNGMVHKGYVIICYDEGNDSFTVYLLDKQRTVVKKIEDIYCDELGKRIDEEIERPQNVSATTYRTKTFEELINA